MKNGLILPLMMVVFASLTSCEGSNGDSGLFGWVAISSIISKDDASGDESVTSFTYAEYDSNGTKTPIKDGLVTTIPIIYQQSMTDSDTEMIEYDYSAKGDTLTIDFTLTDGSKSSDIYLLNSERMAYKEVIDGQGVLLDDIKYDNYGYRTLYDDIVLENSNGVYTQATKDGKLVATYEMTHISNPMGIQQYGIPGEEDVHFCDNFGKQSRGFIASIDTTEKDEYCHYEFDYEFNFDGYIAREIITRNGKPFKTNTYNYVYFSVEK